VELKIRYESAEMMIPIGLSCLVYESWEAYQVTQFSHFLRAASIDPVRPPSLACSPQPAQPQFDQQFVCDLAMCLKMDANRIEIAYAEKNGQTVAPRGQDPFYPTIIYANLLQATAGDPRSAKVLVDHCSPPLHPTRLRHIAWRPAAARRSWSL
jgi:hypothetical protein